MPQIDGDFGFCGAEYVAPDPYQDSQRCINFYIETSLNPGSKTKVVLLGCPGLITINSVVGL